MRPSLSKMCLAIAALMLGTFTAAGQLKDVKLESFAWMAGCWEMSVTQRNMTITEQWMRPAGGTIIGMGRTLAGDRTAMFEYLRIEQEGDAISYIAKPSQNREETVFKLVKAAEGEFVFENLEHDFPQRIIYRREGSDGMFARIEGTRNGELRGIDLPKRRVKCD
ncbi:MAG TPA: DUF6265 family protein [Pyrinomonadaceae bacterium]|nr:DUF6265 family protein [Pyrinomonadaceae bacterium]HMP66794.1 DUF6265 family protein [Pyrinomonadaceae bacterium]